MSMTWDASPSSFFSSSSGMRTYWSLANSNPRTSSLRSTVVLQTGQNVCWRMGAPRRHVSAATQAVMLATLVDHPFSGPGWLFEIKYDGVRVLAERDAGHVKLYGRSGQDFTGRYPEIVEALAGLPVERFVLDGE